MNMKQYKKPTKFYIMIFVFTSVIVLGYSVYLYIKESAELSDLVTLWVLPPIFTLLYYGGDVLIQKIADRKKKVDYEGLFLRAVGEKMSASKEFLIEDFRKLQKSEKFQTQVHSAYEIYHNGESELYTLEKIEKKFRADSLEGRAMFYVCEFVKEKLKEKQN